MAITQTALTESTATPGIIGATATHLIGILSVATKQMTLALGLLTAA